MKNTLYNFKKNQIVLYLLAFVSYSHCIEQNTFCAMFGKEPNSYSLHLESSGALEVDSNWVFPDSVMCEVSFDIPIWDVNYQLDVPADEDTIVLDGASFCTSFKSEPSHTELCIKPKIENVSLSSTSRNDLHFFKIDAKNTLKKFYGMKFKGRWNANLKGTQYTYNKSFDAIISGPCDPKRTIAEYCINKRSLQLVRELDYIPRYLFSSAKECNFCQKNYKENFSTSINYGNGKFVLSEDVLDKDCYDYIPKDAFEIPKSVKNLKSLSGKTLPVRIDSEIQSENSLRKDSYEFNIIVKGICGE